MTNNKNAILLGIFMLLQSLCQASPMNRLNFSTEFNPTNIAMLNSNFKYDEINQDLSIIVGKNVITNAQINGILLSSDNDITLKTDSKIKIYTSEFDHDIENILVNDIPLSQIIISTMESNKLDFINAQNPLWGKKLVIVGDSEASGAFSYGNRLANRNNMSVENHSIGGYKLVGSNQLLEKYQDYIQHDTDYIIVHIGCNDGEYWTGHEQDDDESTDTSTFKGAWNTFLQGLKENYPNAKKAIMSHFYWDTQQGRDTRAKWMMSRCNKYNLEYLDGVESFGFSPTTHAQYFTNENGSPSPYHMSTLGHERVSYIVEQFLKTRVQFSK